MPEITRDEFEALRRQVEANTERLHRGDTAMALIDQRLGQIDDKLAELTIGLRVQQEKPGKRWESVSSTVIQWVVTGLLAFIAVKVGLK